MKKRTMPEAFNEWMDRYINDPQKFSLQWQDVNKHLMEKNSGKEPTYGESCSAFLAKLLDGE